MNYRILNRRIAEQFKNVWFLQDKLLFPFQNEKKFADNTVGGRCNTNMQKSSDVANLLKRSTRKQQFISEKEFCRKPKIEDF